MACHRHDLSNTATTRETATATERRMTGVVATPPPPPPQPRSSPPPNNNNNNTRKRRNQSSSYLREDTTTSSSCLRRRNNKQPRRAATVSAAKQQMMMIAMLLQLLVGGPRVVQASYNVMVPQGERECFYVRVPGDRPSRVSGNFDCLDDGIDESAVSAWVEGANGSKLWKAKHDETEENFAFLVDPKETPKARFCMAYSMADDDDAPSDVYFGFNLRVTSMARERTLDAGEEGPDAERALDLLDEAEEIHDDWRNLLDHFDFLRNREAVHMKVTNQIENRVMFWSLIEAGLVVSMSVGQVLYWRRFFEQRRYL